MGSIRAMRGASVLGDGLRIVEKGLSAGDRVIVSGVQKVFFPGMPVQAKAVVMGAAEVPPTQAVDKN